MTMGILHSKTDDHIVGDQSVRRKPAKLYVRSNTPRSHSERSFRRDATLSRTEPRKGQRILLESTEEMQSRSTEMSNLSPDCFVSSGGNAEIHLSTKALAKRTFLASSIGWALRRPSSASQDSVPPQHIIVKHEYHSPSLEECSERRSCTLPIPNPSPPQDDEDDVENLKRIYDMRTWDMYIRITQSRMHRPTSYSDTATPSNENYILPTGDGGLPHYPPHGSAPHELETTAESDHEMFFGDME